MNKITKIETIEKVLSKICVSRPYFNFDLIKEEDKILNAPIKIEQKHQEGTKLCLGEAMRHLAILGSCAYAINQPEKQYYLATSASGFTNKAEQIGELEAVAKVVNVKNNDLICEALLLNKNGEIVHSTKAQYKIFKEPVFKRLFKKAKCTYPKINNVYQTNFIKDINLFSENSVKATIQSIEPSHCSGHFDNYAVVPIAFLCHHLAQMCCLIKKDLIFKSFEAQFENPPLPFDPIYLSVKRIGNQFDCESIQNGKVCNKLKLSI
jgi:hypothetical protein